MEHFAAIDVSLEWSSVCVVDAAGQIVREAKVRSERADLVAVAPSRRPGTGGDHGTSHTRHRQMPAE
jgi:hypothetical protein